MLKITLIIFLFLNLWIVHAKELSIPLLIDQGNAIKGKLYPLGVGVPFPFGYLKNEDLSTLNIISHKASRVTSNIEVRSRWSDDSIQWIWIDFTGDPYQKYHLVTGDKKDSNGLPGLKLTENEESIHIDTGKAIISFEKGKPTPIRISLHKGDDIIGDGKGVYLIDQNGKTFYTSGKGANLEWEVESKNPLRTVIRVEGNYVLNGEMIAKMILRYDFFYHQSFFKMEHRLIITEDPNKKWFKEYGITMPIQKEGRLSYFGVDGSSIKFDHKKNSSSWVFQKDYPRWSIQKMVCEVGSADKVSHTYKVSDGWAESYSKNKKVGTALAIQNFAKTLPKELMINSKGITAKLWSGRGGVPLDYQPETRLKHFLGENYLKETFFRGRSKAKREDWKEEFCKYPSNSQGTARTHKLVCHYYSGPQSPKEALYTNSIVNRSPEVLADPNWSLSAGVFPKISAKNIKKFPKEEEYISKAFDSLMYRSKDYPMNGWYSYGLCPALQYGYLTRDYYSALKGVDINVKKYIPIIYRLSYIEGYNTTRNVGYLWVRSGERKYLDFLEKQNNAIIDYRVSNYGPKRGLINNSHWHTPTYWPGGLNHFNLDTFSNEDSFASLWMDYYLRDNRSAKQVLEYFTEAFKLHWYKELRNNVKPDDFCLLVLSAWRVTRDAKLLEHVDDVMGRLIDPKSPIGINVDFFKYIRRKEIPAGPKRIARAYRKHKKKVGGGIYEYMRDFAMDDKPLLAMRRAAEELFNEVAFYDAIRYQNLLPLIMLSYYEESREKEYLGVVLQSLRASMHKDIKDGYFSKIAMQHQGFPLYVVPHILRILEYEDGEYPDFPILGNLGNLKMDSIYLQKEKDKPAILKIGNGDLKVKVSFENHKPFNDYSFKKLPIFKGQSIKVDDWYEFKIPKEAPAGTYKINFSTNKFVIFSSNVEKIIMDMPYGISYHGDRILFDKKCFFYVPENRENFRLKIKGGFRIYDPNGQKQPGTKNSNGETVFKSKNMSGLWHFTLDKKGIINFIDIPSFITMGKKSKFFIPEGVSSAKFHSSYFSNKVLVKKSLTKSRIFIHEAKTFPIVTYADGENVPMHWLSYDAKNKVAEISFNDEVNHIFSISVKGQDQIKVVYPETSKIMSHIPRGMLWNKNVPKTLFFRVDTEGSYFEIHQNSEKQKLTIVSGQGKTITMKGRKMVMDISDAMKKTICSISIEEQVKRHHYLGFEGIPPFVAYNPDHVFDTSIFAFEEPPERVEDDTVFSNGIFQDGLHINFNDQLLIPAGQKVENNAREYFNLEKGTFEFFFKLNENPRFSKSFGLPWVVNVDPSEKNKMWKGYFINFRFSNVVTFQHPWEKKQIVAAQLGPWESTLGMTRLKAGQWYHFALSWDCNKELINSNKKIKRFVCKAYLNGVAITFKEWRWGRLGKSMPAPLPSEFIELLSQKHDMVIDELRISRKPRVVLDMDPVQKYPVPSAPYIYDDDTLILMHFDSNFEAVGANQERLLAQWKDRP